MLIIIATLGQTTVVFIDTNNDDLVFIKNNDNRREVYAALGPNNHLILFAPKQHWGNVLFDVNTKELHFVSIRGVVNTVKLLDVTLWQNYEQFLKTARCVKKQKIKKTKKTEKLLKTMIDEHNDKQNNFMMTGLRIVSLNMTSAGASNRKDKKETKKKCEKNNNNKNDNDNASNKEQNNQNSHSSVMIPKIIKALTWVLSKDISILCLQEVACGEEDLNNTISLHLPTFFDDYELFFTPGIGGRGVVTIVKRIMNPKVITDPHVGDRVLWVECDYKSEKINVINCYYNPSSEHYAGGPTRDRVMREDLSYLSADLSDENHANRKASIILGDMNVSWDKFCEYCPFGRNASLCFHYITPLLTEPHVPHTMRNKH